MDVLKQTLLHRLRAKGMDLKLIPGFFKSLSHSVYADHHMNLEKVNQRLKYMGWDDVELDYYTLQLAVEWLEANGRKGLQYTPHGWFEHHFASRVDFTRAGGDA